MEIYFLTVLKSKEKALTESFRGPSLDAWPIFSARTGEKAREMAAASAKDADPSESGLRPPVLVLITSSETPLPNAASLEVML